MDPLEKKLKSLSLAEPSSRLKESIFGPAPTTPWFAWITPSFTPAWGMGFAAVLLLLGLGWAGLSLSQPTTANLTQKTVVIQHTLPDTPEPWFDYSGQTESFMSGTIVASIEIQKETHP